MLSGSCCWTAEMIRSNIAFEIFPISGLAGLMSLQGNAFAKFTLWSLRVQLSSESKLPNERWMSGPIGCLQGHCTFSGHREGLHWPHRFDVQAALQLAPALDAPPQAPTLHSSVELCMVFKRSRHRVWHQMDCAEESGRLLEYHEKTQLVHCGETGNYEGGQGPVFEQEIRTWL